MAPKARIYHNPRCTKSRQTLALLQEHGVEPEVIEYLKTPLSTREVDGLIDALKIEPHALLRTKEAPYAEEGLSAKSPRKVIVDAIVRHPVLLERPVVIVGKRAVIGRPPENVLPLLS